MRDLPPAELKSPHPSSLDWHRTFRRPAGAAASTGGAGRSGASRLTRCLRAIGAGLILGVWIYYLMGQWGALRAHAWTLAPGPLLIGFGCAVAGWLLIGLGWWQAVRAVGGRLGPIPAVRIWILSMVWRYLPGNVWHFFGRAYLAGQAGESRMVVIASSALEQILTLAGACLVLLLCAIGWPGGRWLAAPAALGLAGSLLILQPAIGRPVSRVLARWTGQDAHLVAPTPGRLLGLVGLFAGAQLCTGLSLWALAGAIGATAAPAPLIGAAVAGWAIGYLSLLTPSGLGVREGAVIVLLTPLIGAPAALLAGLLSRAVAMLAEAALWCVGALWRT